MKYDRLLSSTVSRRLSNFKQSHNFSTQSHSYKCLRDLILRRVRLYWNRPLVKEMDLVQNKVNREWLTVCQEHTICRPCAFCNDITILCAGSAYLKLVMLPVWTKCDGTFCPIWTTSLLFMNTRVNFRKMYVYEYIYGMKEIIYIYRMYVYFMLCISASYNKCLQLIFAN